ncbi:MAG: ABC transporter ATP-binding protein [Acidobacteria bacterium]|nr:ABC transporter ATP-binding protein [Acidobacteriota bacterium]
MTALLELDDVNVWFEREEGGELHAVQGVSLAIEPGERLGLVGESGCGKTTSALAIMGLLPPNASVSGSVLIDGVDVLAGGEATMRGRRWVDVAIVFQGAMNALNPVRTVGAQIVEALELHGRAKGKVVQAQILELLDALCRDFGLALILVTHDLPVVAHLCDRGAVMYAGEIVERGDVDALYHEPRHPYTRMLFAATPDLSDDRGEIMSIPGAPPRLDRPIDGCPFRPRCDRAFAPCVSLRPALQPVGNAHAAACHLNGVTAQVEA